MNSALADLAGRISEPNIVEGKRKGSRESQLAASPTCLEIEPSR